MAFNALNARNLTKIYKNDMSITAVDTVSFSIEQGEFLAITGPSGSGKSTLLNLLGTLDSPTSGQLFINGEDVGQLVGDSLADFRRQNIGFIFQLFNLVQSLTAVENVLLPLLPYQRGLAFNIYQRASQLLAQFGLADRINHLPSQLSGGEQQRVAIARALINQPRILLADEPTGNLDTTNSAEIIELLKQLNRDFLLTIVMVTHDEQLANFVNRRLHMVDGKISRIAPK